MKAFHYRLQRVLDAREAMMTRCEMQLADSERELEESRREQAQCHENLANHVTLHATATRNATLSAREHLTQRAWFQHLSDQINQAVKTAIGKFEDVEHKRNALQKALVDHKILEQLSNKERGTWVTKMLKTEQTTLDEQASMAYLRHRGDPLARSGNVLTDRENE